MKRRLISLIFALVLISVSAVPVAAETQPPGTGESLTKSTSAEDVSVSVSDGVIGFASDEPTEVKADDSKNENSTVAATGVYPFEIQYNTHNGAPIVIKSFRVSAGFDPANLIEQDFEDTGYTYTKKDILMNTPAVKTEQKLVAQTVTFSTEDNAQSTLLATLSPIIEYSEAGYSGQLELDYGSIQSVVASRENYSYPIRKTVEYSNLDRNDYAYLDKSIDNLTLQGAEWTSLGGSQRGDAFVPSNFTATAVYTGVGYGTKITGYNNTAIYKGTVTRTYDGEAVYSVIYQGTKIPSDFPWSGVGIGFVLLVIIAGGAFLIITKLIPALASRKASRNTGTGPINF